MKKTLLKEGDVIDFTSQEPVYFDKKTPENKVEKIVCPICGRICRPSNNYSTYDHVLTVKGFKSWGLGQETTDVCHYDNEVEINKQVDILRVAKNLGFTLEQTLKKYPEISANAILIVRLRKMYE